jgi:hypothetical protein
MHRLIAKRRIEFFTDGDEGSTEPLKNHSSYFLSSSVLGAVSRRSCAPNRG